MVEKDDIEVYRSAGTVPDCIATEGHIASIDTSIDPSIVPYS